MPLSDILCKICCIFPKPGYRHFLLADANGNGSPSGTPRAQRRPTPAPAIANSVFYPDVRDPGAANNNHSTVSGAERKRRQVKALEEFARNHERFRRELMPDVSAYRERQGQPLIQL